MNANTQPRGFPSEASQKALETAAPSGMNSPDTSLPPPKRRSGIRHRPHRFDKEIENALRPLYRPDTLKAVLGAAEDWFWLAVGGFAVIFGFNHFDQLWALPLMLLAWLVIGSRMRGLATLLHESAHKSLTRRIWLNYLLGTLLSAWWILQLRWRYAQTHIGEHHPFLADPDFDPDTKQYARQGLLQQPADHLVARNLFNALSGAKTLVNFPYLMRDRLLPQPGAKLSRAQLLEIVSFTCAWITLITVLAVNGWLVAFLLVWVVPYLTTFQALNWLIETSEHFPLVWSRSDSFQVTRNRKGPLLERFLTGIHGEGWHRVHHVRPGIPFCNLAKAHAIMMRDPEYAAFEYETAGLFCAGVNGEPSILSALQTELGKFKATLAAQEVTP